MLGSRARSSFDHKPSRLELSVYLSRSACIADVEIFFVAYVDFFFIACVVGHVREE